MIDLFSYLRHFFISNSRHGTHSPFVYAIADQVIYNKHFKSANAITYPNGVKLLPQLHNILSYLNVRTVSISLSDLTADAFWLDHVKWDHIEDLLNIIDSGKIVVIQKPYSKKQSPIWNTLISDNRVTVSINLFHFGLLLHRDAQHKEDFWLRQQLW
ncbi:hypothetical protein ACFRAE_11150 [Sphingobacterium sp. HJSM2_6]|uniref:hypothetical protein n=1 Tax=Sphingobacterium sp. HJSM2_6 TaxID=3366264 RepID=UPI003BDA24DE